MLWSSHRPYNPSHSEVFRQDDVCSARSPVSLSSPLPQMRLTDYTDYALRVLLFLAVRDEGLTTIQDISEAYGISKNHLMKVVQRLGELGWIETVRGRNGGLRLNARSLGLTIGEVVRGTESDFALVGCFPREGGEPRHCVIEPQCRLKEVFEAARGAFLAELDRYTLGELVGPAAAPLAELLGLSAAGATARPVVTITAVRS